MVGYTKKNRKLFQYKDSTYIVKLIKSGSLSEDEYFKKVSNLKFSFTPVNCQDFKVFKGFKE